MKVRSIVLTAFLLIFFVAATAQAELENEPPPPNWVNPKVTDSDSWTSYGMYSTSCCSSETQSGMLCYSVTAVQCGTSMTFTYQQGQELGVSATVSGCGASGTVSSKHTVSQTQQFTLTAGACETCELRLCFPSSTIKFVKCNHSNAFAGESMSSRVTSNPGGTPTWDDNVCFDTPATCEALHPGTCLEGCEGKPRDNLTFKSALSQLIDVADPRCLKQLATELDAMTALSLNDSLDGAVIGGVTPKPVPLDVHETTIHLDLYTSPSRPTVESLGELNLVELTFLWVQLHEAYADADAQNVDAGIVYFETSSGQIIEYDLIDAFGIVDRSGDLLIASANQADINEDGVLDNQDLDTFNFVISGQNTDPVLAYNCDLNADGELDNVDLGILQLKLP